MKSHESHKNDPRTVQEKFLGLPHNPALARDTIAEAREKGAKAEDKARRMRNAIGKTFLAAGLAAGIATHDATPKVIDGVVGIVSDTNDRVNNDRIFNPEQGNPDNAHEIVVKWDQSPEAQIPVKGGGDGLQDYPK